MQKETLQVNKENLDFIRNLVMYAEDDLQFFCQIRDYLYRLGHKLNDRKKEIIYQDKLHELSEVINEIF